MRPTNRTHSSRTPRDAVAAIGADRVIGHEVSAHHEHDSDEGANREEKEGNQPDKLHQAACAHGFAFRFERGISHLRYDWRRCRRFVSLDLKGNRHPAVRALANPAMKFLGEFHQAFAVRAGNGEIWHIGRSRLGQFVTLHGLTLQA